MYLFNKYLSNPILAGFFLALLALFLQLYRIPLEIAAGLKYFGDYIFFKSYFLHPLSILILGIVVGAFTSSCLFKEFSIKLPSKIDFLKSVLAGLLMGVGASLALGCNIGGFYTSIVNLSASGITMMIGLLGGTLIGIKYLIWEAEHFSQKGGVNIYLKNIEKIGTFIGLVIFLFLILKIPYYRKILITSAILGFLAQRSRFCMANAFREPFVLGESLTLKSFAFSLIIAMVGTIFLKYKNFQEPYFYINPAFIWGSLIGGLIFGIGMVLADACALGSLWKLGEGQIKSFIVIILFGLTFSLCKYYLDILNVWEKGYLGKKVYLPDYLTYPGTFLFITAILFLLILFTEWNKRSKKFIIKV